MHKKLAALFIASTLAQGMVMRIEKRTTEERYQEIFFDRMKHGYCVFVCKDQDAVYETRLIKKKQIDDKLKRFQLVYSLFPELLSSFSSQESFMSLEDDEKNILYNLGLIDRVQDTFKINSDANVVFRFCFIEKEGFDIRPKTIIGPYCTQKAFSKRVSFFGDDIPISYLGFVVPWALFEGDNRDYYGFVEPGYEIGTSPSKKRICGRDDIVNIVLKNNFRDQDAGLYQGNEVNLFADAYIS